MLAEPAMRTKIMINRNSVAIIVRAVVTGSARRDEASDLPL